jgi:predicted MFS family arabinose efflux permease
LRAFRSVFANAGLRRLELAWALSETGKWLYIVALAVFAYDVGGTAAVGVVALIRIFPSALLAPFAGLVADRFRREHVMLGASVLRAALFGLAAAAVLLDLPAGVVYACAGLVTILSTTFRPAQAALLPSLARSPEELTAANVATTTIASVGSFAGPAIGGVLLAATSVEVVFAATAGTFLVSAILVAGMHGPRPSRRAGVAASHPLAAAFAGFGTIARNGTLRVLVGLYAAQTLVAGALMVLIVVAAIELLDLGDSGVGYLNSAFGVGGLVGAGLTLALVARQRLGSDFALGMLLWGLPLVVVGLWAEPGAALVLLALVGVGDTLIEVAAPTLLQRAVPDEVLARVFGALESVLIGAMGIGAILAPPLVDWFGIRGALIATGALLPVLGLLFWRRLAAIDREAPIPVRELDLLRGIPIFAPLPPPTLEELASSLVPVEVPAGSRVFAQGDDGDRFYVIGEGEVDVSIDGRAIRTEGPGEYFGEIALLHETPRTATVVAKGDARLYALERDEFLAAVTGHAESRTAADARVSSLLNAPRTALATE